MMTEDLIVGTLLGIMIGVFLIVVILIVLGYSQLNTKNTAQQICGLFGGTVNNYEIYQKDGDFLKLTCTIEPNIHTIINGVK
jgi:hypothetical protein